MKKIKTELEKQQNKEKSKDEKEDNEDDDKDDMFKNAEEMFNELMKLIANYKNENSQVIYPDEFEKDNDANFHIDFIYSMTNLRSLNYSLAPMDWITVKLKAGRIIPALATTTSTIAGLQSIELVKLIANFKLEQHRNTFLNLALPIFSMSEPGNVTKEKITETLETDLWDRWELKLPEKRDTTIKNIID